MAIITTPTPAEFWWWDLSVALGCRDLGCTLDHYYEIRNRRNVIFHRTPSGVESTIYDDGGYESPEFIIAHQIRLDHQKAVKRSSWVGRLRDDMGL